MKLWRRAVCWWMDRGKKVSKRELQHLRLVASRQGWVDAPHWKSPKERAEMK